MATVREVILPNQQKKDGTYNVKIRVIHQKKVYYLKTQHFIKQNQFRKDNTIKDPFILKVINPVIDGYRTKISELGPKLELYNMSRLINYLTNNDVTVADQINVIEFGRKKIEELNASGRKASASNMSTVIYSLVDYFKTDFVPITEIRAKMLLEYEKYLRSERKLVRTNQLKPHCRIVPGLSDTGLHNHMRDLRILFNKIKDHFSRYS